MRSNILSFMRHYTLRDQSIMVEGRKHFIAYLEAHARLFRGTLLGETVEAYNADTI